MAFGLAELNWQFPNRLRKGQLEWAASLPSFQPPSALVSGCFWRGRGELWLCLSGVTHQDQGLFWVSAGGCWNLGSVLPCSSRCLQGLCTGISLCTLDTVLRLQQFLLKGPWGNLRPQACFIKVIKRQREYSGLSEAFNKLPRRKTRFHLRGLQGMESISCDLANQLFKCLRVLMEGVTKEINKVLL